MTLKDLYKYSGVVLRVVDGDTLICTVDLGMKVFKQVTIRLASLNTPELNSKDATERAKAVQAKAYLDNLVGGKTIYFDSKSIDMYDRSIAEVFLTGSPVSINKKMIDSGLAVAQKY